MAPGAKKRVEILHNEAIQVAAPPLPEELPGFYLKAFHRLGRCLQARPALHRHAVAKKLAVPRTVHPAPSLIDLKPQLLFQIPLERGYHPFTGLPSSHVDVTVVGIPAEAMAPPFQFLVEIVQQDVTEQRGKRSALRRTFLPRLRDPPSMIPLCRYRRINLSIRLSLILRATRAISTSWLTLSKNFSRSISTTQRRPDST